MFGEHGAVNNQPSPFTIEAISNKTIIFQISMQNLVEKFGGERGCPVQHLRSMAVMKSNWLAMKKQFLTYMNAKRVEALEFRNEEEFRDLRP